MISSPVFQEYVHSPEFLHALDLPFNSSLNFSPLGQGEYNTNYRFSHPVTGKELVLRINTGSQMHLSDQIGYEFSALNTLKKSGRTPAPLFCDGTKSILPYGILVMEWLPGRALRYETDLNTAAEILADIHALSVERDCPLLYPAHPLQSIYDECLAMVEHYFQWEKASVSVCHLLESMIQEIGNRPLRSAAVSAPCIVNTELNSGNFLINENSTSYLIDWEKPILSEPSQDIGHFLVPTTTFWKTDVILTSEEISSFVNHYITASAGRFDISEIRDRLPLYFSTTCLRGVTWCAMAMVEYSTPGRVISNADTFHKIKQYLEEDFLGNILNNYMRRNFLG
ncbi:MAG: phosphotransferase [Oscillospiraceae bacterium]|nr:phosphotransferase [Oscillospiraceae bacterium]